ncbi:hypothetical protein [Paraburkholderia sp. J11-2]|uniref:hypothetical protein n=1 Tax=Paraburkholderia sp. J11-2 TaxID=2805431 RepID=UPI002AB62106|nr:hypothetical protein [Paraburkholderia sp. J11-2]
MSHLSQAIDVLPVESEILTPSEFLKLMTTKPSMIKESKVVPGRLGTKDFGSFRVTYTRPIYKTL